MGCGLLNKALFMKAYHIVLRVQTFVFACWSLVVGCEYRITSFEMDLKYLIIDVLGFAMQHKP